ncbi:hypothetical protein [Candidatus Nitrospira bockiana]
MIALLNLSSPIAIIDQLLPGRCHLFPSLHALLLVMVDSKFRGHADSLRRPAQRVIRFGSVLCQPANLVLLCLLIGCQHPFTQRSSAGPDSSFQELWAVYRHCQESDTPEELLYDAAVLNRFGGTPQHSVPRLFRPVQGLIDPPVSRLAVDPYAMAQACTLKAADAALNVGWSETAMGLYRQIIPKGPSAGDYYVRQAEARLTDMFTQTTKDGTTTSQHDSDPRAPVPSTFR